MGSGKKSAEKPVEPSIVASVDEPKKHRSKRLLFVCVIVVVVVVLGITAWIFLRNRARSSNNSVSASQQISTPSDLANNGDYSQAQQQLAKQAAALTGQKQVDVYVQKATIALSAQQYSDALQFAQKAESLMPSSNTAYLVAASQQALGNNTEAIKYYQLAVSRIKNPTELQQIDIRDYQATIKSLGG